MAIQNGKEINCLLNGVPSNASAQDLLDRDIPADTYTMQLVRDCNHMPGTRCEGCCLAQIGDIRIALQDLAFRVGQKMQTSDVLN